AIVGGKPDTKMNGETMIFADGKVNIGAAPVPYKVDASASPKTIDITFPTGKGAAVMKVPGIYKMEGNTLVLCLPQPDRKDIKRPEDFDGAEGIVITLRRPTKEDSGYSRKGSINNLKQMGLAIHSYHDA